MRVPLLRHPAVRRRAGTVCQQMLIRSALGDTRYFLCPACGILLEREFVRYCDQCGQKLNWQAVADW